MKQFPNEEAARKHIEKIRWNGKPVCPRCKNDVRQYERRTRPGYHLCKNCNNEYTVRTGSILERSHIPLHKWLHAAYSHMTARKGVSSLQLSKELGHTQKSTWHLSHRIREACGDDNNPQLLKGEVEADESYFGGKEANKHASKQLKAGRGTIGKTPVLGIRERGGRVGGIVLKDTSKKTIQGELNKRIDKDSTLYTDEHKSYQGNKFNHKTVNHSAKQFVDGQANTNSIESYWSLLKRGHYGTHHHFSKKHLQKYVDEFAFRLNDGNVKRHTMERIDSLLNNATGKRLTYKRLTKGNPEYIKENGQYEMIKSVLKVGALQNLMENAPLNKSVKISNIKDSKDILAEAKSKNDNKSETNNTENNVSLK